MPNGFDQSWIRLCAAVDGFHHSHGKWPPRVLIFPTAIKTLRTIVFSEESFAILTSRLELVPSESPFVAEDDDGNQYSFGKQGFPESRPSPSTEDWLGLQPDGPGTKHDQQRNA
jgi:hypothetical protein